MAENFIKYANSFQTVISLGLGRIAALLKLMGDPQKEGRYIHIAGTNGKGSVCAILEAGLMAAGLKVGKYTSPNLIRVNERITVNGSEISDDELNPLLNHIGALCETVQREMGECPTQFEVWTAAAFEYFKQKKCDYVLLEVGLGGTYDATNVIPKNELAIITRVALDHCALLGNTEAEIAVNKCGIIKQGCPTVALRQSPEVNRVIESAAKELNSPLTWADVPKSTGFKGMSEIFSMHDMENLSCSLGGVHQLENAAVAVEAALALGLDAEAVRAGLLSARHPARLEQLAPGLIFDGAHNPNGVEALNAALSRYFPEERQTIIFACMKDKDIKPSLKLLNSPLRRFIFTQVEGNPRSMTPKELQALAKECGIEGDAAQNLAAAVETAADLGDLTVICGSLYLYEAVPEALPMWKK